MRRMEKLKLKVSKSLCITAESFKCTPLKIYSSCSALLHQPQQSSCNCILVAQ